MYPMYVLGSDISPFNVTSAMKVRVIRAYNVSERTGSNAIRCKEIVFHDSEEGSVWAVKNFLVINNFYTYRTTPHKYMIKFNYQTIAKQFKRIEFPSQMFRLTPFEALKVEGVNDKLLVDVIGKVAEIYSPQEKMISGRTTRLIDFIIEDLSGNQIRCTLWDDHVGKIEPFFNASSHEPMVVILQFCRIRRDATNGEVRLCSSYDVTQVLINQQSKEFLEFRESMGTTGLQLG
ncbi:PREDICTED: uncharacterized protein LOC109191995 [Ipomoea nil]|uniref:uncharacterized protein LOC109174218 n=1 Tax=Ipomoea nil TaxID=35883 RepID=UPI00090109ED|nr:PREDICTED: uncharacterized protein LOC109174218 [Ipomoea nil]XP_019198169.1 PREDICTED: uncharacterized protein LOC109191995 [Ipomoea nil]